MYLEFNRHPLIEILVQSMLHLILRQRSQINLLWDWQLSILPSVSQSESESLSSIIDVFTTTLLCFLNLDQICRNKNTALSAMSPYLLFDTSTKRRGLVSLKTGGQKRTIFSGTSIMGPSLSKQIRWQKELVSGRYTSGDAVHLTMICRLWANWHGISISSTSGPVRFFGSMPSSAVISESKEHSDSQSIDSYSSFYSLPLEMDRSSSGLIYFKQELILNLSFIMIIFISEKFANHITHIKY